MKNIIFLDVDGVLNCQLFYNSKQFSDYKAAKKQLRKDVKVERIERLDYYSGQICKDRIKMLNELCSETDSKIVVSSTWRSNQTVEQLQEMFNYCGGTFEILDKTGYCECRTRGCEIHKWLYDNTEKHFGIKYFDFYRYAIIDDDSDMLLNQQNHFFQTDNWSGLTPNTCYKIKRFFTHETF
jgi:hypothetical protein